APTPRVRETKTAPETSTASEVWVNTRSGKYWKPGSRYYGKTKEGEFMSELEALIVDMLRRAGQANRLCQETRNLQKLSPAEQSRPQRPSQAAFWFCSMMSQT